jgi:hypothetical protein
MIAKLSCFLASYVHFCPWQFSRSKMEFISPEQVSKPKNHVSRDPVTPAINCKKFHYILNNMEEMKPRNMVGRIKQIDECCHVEWRSCFLKMLKRVFGLIMRL